MNLLFFITRLLILLSCMQPLYQFSGKINFACDQFSSDPIGNIYLIREHTIYKYNSDLEKLAVYSNAYLGNITSIDVSDPLRILLYYREFNQIVWLDNFFQEIKSPVRLDDLGIDQADLVCSSNQGGFWVFNRLNNQIQYFDVKLKMIHESIGLNPLLGDMKPVAMVENSQVVYLNVPETGLLLFDRFGTYSRTLPVFPDNHFQVTDNYIFYFIRNSFKKYDLTSFNNTDFELPEKTGLLSVMIQPGYLYLLKIDGVYIYKNLLPD